jgi:hypothetical protein
MVINKSAWHYKLTKLTVGRYVDISESLCGYFWQVVLCLYTTFLVLPIMILGGWVIISGDVLLDDFSGVALYVMTALSVNGILLWSCVSGVIVVFIMAIVEYFNRKQKHNHEPSLVKEYIKSKKQKICPIIEFKDNEKGE